MLEARKTFPGCWAHSKNWKRFIALRPNAGCIPTNSDLARPGHQLLLTKFGPLDVLGMIGKSPTWDDLQGHFRSLEVEPGVVVRVIDLETLIEVKEDLGFPKDAAMLPVLRQALREWSARQS